MKGHVQSVEIAWARGSQAAGSVNRERKTHPETEKDTRKFDRPSEVCDWLIHPDFL